MGNPTRGLASRCLLWLILMSMLACIACSPVRHPSKPVVPVTLFSCSDVAVPPFAWNAPEDIVYKKDELEKGRAVPFRAVSRGVAFARQMAASLGEKGITATTVSLDGTPSLQAQIDELREQGYSCVLFGRVERYEERIGSDWSVNRSASVAFTVLLVETAAGRVVWRGSFDEKQQPLSENLLALKRFVLRKARWVTADALVRSGFKGLVDSMALVGANPRVVDEDALVQ